MAGEWAHLFFEPIAQVRQLAESKSKMAALVENGTAEDKEDHVRGRGQ
jgi:hypothetical protein